MQDYEYHRHHTVIEHKLGAICELLEIPVRKEEFMTTEVQALTDAVTVLNGTIDVAVTAIADLVAKLQAAISAGDMAQVATITAEIKAFNDTLVAAIASVPK